MCRLLRNSLNVVALAMGMMHVSAVATEAPTWQPASTRAPAQAIRAAANGLVAEVEDDVHPDARLKSITTKGCASTVAVIGRKFTIDWTTVRVVALQETFLAIDSPAGTIGLVVDTSNPAQANKLSALRDAMHAMATQCQAHQSSRPISTGATT